MVLLRCKPCFLPPLAPQLPVPEEAECARDRSGCGLFSVCRSDLGYGHQGPGARPQPVHLPGLEPPWHFTLCGAVVSDALLRLRTGALQKRPRVLGSPARPAPSSPPLCRPRR